MNEKDLQIERDAYKEAYEEALEVIKKLRKRLEQYEQPKQVDWDDGGWFGRYNE